MTRAAIDFFWNCTYIHHAKLIICINQKIYIRYTSLLKFTYLTVEITINVFLNLKKISKLVYEYLWLQYFPKMNVEWAVMHLTTQYTTHKICVYMWMRIYKILLSTSSIHHHCSLNYVEWGETATFLFII